MRLKVATYNVNSIRSRLHIIIPWLEENEPDLLCMQETKVDDTKFPVKAFEDIGYRVVFHGTGRYNGVAIASKEELEDVRFGLFGRDPDRLVRGVYRGIHVINTYVPQGYKIDSPRYQYKLQWLRDLRRLFEQEYDPSWMILWCGDMNVAPEEIDVHNPKRLKNHVDFHIEARKAFKEVVEWGFVDVFRKHHPDEPHQYTFYDYRVPKAIERKLGWRVDHILATKPLAEKSVDSYIDMRPRLAEKPSDHTILVAEFEI